VRILPASAVTLAFLLAVAPPVRLVEALQSSPPQSSTPPRSPAEVAARIQARYDAVRDFSAEFVQSYEGGLLKQRSTERGTVVVKKPGRMRWTYTSPEQKLFVSDGQRTFYYVPEDRQVIVSKVPAEDQATTAVLFLVGKGRLTRDFVVTSAEIAGSPPGTVAVRLDPKATERDYEWLALVVDQHTYALRMLVAGDGQGGRSSFTFSKLRENTNPPDRNFTFDIPRGVAVVER